MDGQLFYISKKNQIYSKEDIEKAFEIYSGQYAFENESAYLKFLNSLFGRSIKEYKILTVTDLVAMGCRAKAIKLYRDTKNCSLIEARDYVDKLFNNIFAPVG